MIRQITLFLILYSCVGASLAQELNWESYLPVESPDSSERKNFADTHIAKLAKGDSVVWYVAYAETDSIRELRTRQPSLWGKALLNEQPKTDYMVFSYTNAYKMVIGRDSAGYWLSYYVSQYDASLRGNRVMSRMFFKLLHPRRNERKFLFQHINTMRLKDKHRLAFAATDKGLFRCYRRSTYYPYGTQLTVIHRMKTRRWRQYFTAHSGLVYNAYIVNIIAADASKNKGINIREKAANRTWNTMKKPK